MAGDVGSLVTMDWRFFSVFSQCLYPQPGNWSLFYCKARDIFPLPFLQDTIGGYSTPVNL